MSIVKHVVIAAAGMGSRLGYGMPKCLLDVGGETLLARQLSLVADVEDVRLVVGFEKERIIDAAREVRRDIIFRINAAYRTTTTADSYDMGASGIDDWCLFMDADILFERDAFDRFCAECKPGRRKIGITEAKTEDAVFVHLNEREEIVRFSRTDKSAYEWANVAWLPSSYFTGHSDSAYSRIAQELPVTTGRVDSYEIDTEADLQRARRFVTDRPGR